jgi:TolB-like protein
MAPISGRVSFGPFELDLETGELRKSGRILKLRPQPVRVLCLLVSQAGKLVSREDIRHRLWGESTFVDYEVGVDYCVNRIRSVLCDQARAPRYVETLPRRGYRFIAPVKRNRPFVEPTLAVLPFANLNGDPAREYFADGVTDALITELAHIQAVRVISRQSVLHLKGSSRKLDEIARDLRVDGVVEGAVLHEGNRVRVTAQLILMEPERHAWAQSYDCDLSAILTTQRDAARAIAACVATVLRPPGAVMPASVPERPVAPEIIETYLKARTELGKMSAEGIGKALQYLREITAKAPDFALGLAGHAACLFSLGWWGHAPTREVYPSAKQMAVKAVSIDDSAGYAHVVLAMTNWLLDWDLAACEREFRRTIELGPSNPDAHIFYAMFLCFVGRHSESIAEAQYGLRLDPTSLLPNTAAAWIYLNNRRHGEAEVQAGRTIESFPDSLHAHFVLGWAVWCQGRAEEAVAAFEKALSLSREAFSLSFLGHIYARLGRREEAEGLLRELDQLFAQGQAPPITFVVIYAGLGDADAAFGWFETAYRLRDDMSWLFTGFPGIDPLRSDPRFAQFVHRMGLAVPSLARTE